MIILRFFYKLKKYFFVNKKISYEENVKQDLFNRAYLLLHEEKIDLSDNFYLQSIQNNDFIFKYFDYFENYYTTEESLQSSINTLEYLTTKYSDFSPPFYFLGIAYEAIGMPEKALELYESYLKKKDANILAIRKLAFVNYFQFGNYEKAIQYCTNALDLFPNDFYSLEILGFIYEHGYSDYENACYFYEKALLQKKNNTTLLYNLGVLYFYHYGNPLKSLDYINLAIMLKSDNAQYLFFRANLFHNLNLLLEAKDDCSRAIDIGSNIYISDVYALRAEINLQLGNIEEYNRDMQIMRSTKYEFPF